MRRQTLETFLVAAVFLGAFTWFSACGDDGEGGGDGGGGSNGASVECPPPSTSSTSSSSSASSGAGAGTTVGTPEQGGNPGTVGGEGNTFDHFNDIGLSGHDPFELLKQLNDEGPPEVRTRLHSCTKIPYSTLGNVLRDFGVDMNSSGNVVKTAGQLYREGADMMGAPQYEAREPEKYFHTTAGAARLFDIFAQAAPEIIEAMPTLPQCQLDGQGFEVFATDDEGVVSCTAEALACLIARPATQEDVALCNLIIASAAPGDADDLETKQNIAVAVALAAAHTCE